MNGMIAVALTLSLLVSGCTAQQQREMVQANIACLRSSYDSPEGASFRARQPFNVQDATLAQLADRSLATPTEAASISEIHPRLQACQKELLTRLGELLPSIAPLFARSFRDSDDDLL